MSEHSLLSYFLPIFGFLYFNLNHHPHLLTNPPYFLGILFIIGNQHKTLHQVFIRFIPEKALVFINRLKVGGF